MKKIPYERIRPKILNQLNQSHQEELTREFQQYESQSPTGVRQKKMLKSPDTRCSVPERD